MTHRALDFDDLHRWLWSQRDRQDTVRIESQLVLAREWGISQVAMHRTIHTFVREERIRKASTKSVMRGRFVVTDPDAWAASRAPQ